MTFKDELDAVVAAAISDMGEIRAQLRALEQAMPGACGRTGNVRQIMMTLTTRLTGIKLIAAKEVMCGNEAPGTLQERTEDLELFANVPRKALQCGMTGVSLELLRASLRRAGDDSLDEEETL
jgi:hypothetical protein